MSTLRYLAISMAVLFTSPSCKKSATSGVHSTPYCSNYDEGKCRRVHDKCAWNTAKDRCLANDSDCTILDQSDCTTLYPKCIWADSAARCLAFANATCAQGSGETEEFCQLLGDCEWEEGVCKDKVLDPPE